MMSPGSARPEYLPGRASDPVSGSSALAAMTRRDPPPWPVRSGPSAPITTTLVDTFGLVRIGRESRPASPGLAAGALGGYRRRVTRDRETADAELIYSTAERLWNDAQAQPGEDRASVEDLAIAHETGVELDEVREWLDEADG